MRRGNAAHSSFLTLAAKENGMSEKRENFVRLASKRTTNVLNCIRVLGNLANRGSYEFTEDDVNKIVAAIQKELGSVESKFRNVKESKSLEFTL